MVRVSAGDDDIRGAAALRWEWKGRGEPGGEAFAERLVDWARAHADSHTCFVAEADGEIVGCTWLALTTRVPAPAAFTRLTGDIQSVYVTPAARRTGVGAELIRAALDRAERAGAERVVVHSSPGAVAFYRSLGFQSSDILLDVDLPVGGRTISDTERI